jgi:predicted metal-dependent phosphoesterase TrpH
MARDLLRRGDGRFFRGNLHCHSNRSDGVREPEEVIAAYREAGYDFIVLSDHFEAEYGWQVTDTRHLRSNAFTTIIGAELSSAGWRERNVYWVVAAGLPLDFEPPPPDDHASAISRAHEAGAFVVLLHPGLNNLPLAEVEHLPGFAVVEAVEIYNHSLTTGAGVDRASGAYMLDGLLEKGRRLTATAADDSHFQTFADRFGGWVEVHAAALDPTALLASLKAGTYYSTQGPRIDRLALDGDELQVSTSPAYCIALGGAGDRWLDGTERRAEAGAGVTDATFDVSPFRGSYCRVTVISAEGRRAWSNPIWLPPVQAPV